MPNRYQRLKGEKITRHKKRGPKPIKPGDWETKEALQRFVLELAKDGNIKAAAKRAKTTRNRVYKWRYKDPEFEQAVVKARIIGLDVLKDHAHNLAYKGLKRHTYYQGKSVGVHTEYSEGLLKFLIQQADPSYVPTNRVEHSGNTAFVFEMALHPAAQLNHDDSKLIESDDE